MLCNEICNVRIYGICVKMNYEIYKYVKIIDNVC